MREIKGKCSNVEAVHFFEVLLDYISDDFKTESFCRKYEMALNRFRKEASKERICVTREIDSGKYFCGSCGEQIDKEEYQYCPYCGIEIFR